VISSSDKNHSAAIPSVFISVPPARPPLKARRPQTKLNSERTNPNAFKTLRWEIDDLRWRGYTWGDDLKSLIPSTR